MSWIFDYKAHHEERRRQREADAQARAARLSPEIVQLWTEVVRNAALRVEQGERPCDYRPWAAALAAAGEAYGLMEYAGGTLPQIAAPSRFSAFLWDVALPRWPEPRRDLIEFALTVLEADVKLFRSGYAQKNLIRRLQQAQLTGFDVARIDKLLRRAVMFGSGFEEYGAWCRLAGHLVALGQLKDLPSWLATEANGAILTLGMSDGRLWHQILDAMPEADVKKMDVGMWRRQCAHGVAWPDLGTLVTAGPAVDSVAQRKKRNAWRMLDRILQRCPSMLQDCSVN